MAAAMAAAGSGGGKVGVCRYLSPAAKYILALVPSGGGQQESLTPVAPDVRAPLSSCWPPVAPQAPRHSHDTLLPASRSVLPSCCRLLCGAVSMATELECLGLAREC